MPSYGDRFAVEHILGTLCATPWSRWEPWSAIQSGGIVNGIPPFKWLSSRLARHGCRTGSTEWTNTSSG